MIDRIYDWLFDGVWRFLAVFLGVPLIIIAAVAPFAWRADRLEREELSQWCRERGYGVASVSEKSGKITIRETLCIDDQRRLILPEKK